MKNSRSDKLNSSQEVAAWNGLTDAERDSLCTHWRNDGRQLCLDIEAVLKHKNPAPAPGGAGGSVVARSQGDYTYCKHGVSADDSCMACMVLGSPAITAKDAK